MENNKKDDIDISPAIMAGLEALSDPETKVPSNQIENLVAFKEVLRALLRGELQITSTRKLDGEEQQNPPDQN